MKSQNESFSFNPDLNGSDLRDIRREFDASQVEFAKFLGVSQGQLSRYENWTDPLPVKFKEGVMTKLNGLSSIVTKDADKYVEGEVRRLKRFKRIMTKTQEAIGAFTGILANELMTDTMKRALVSEICPGPDYFIFNSIESSQREKDAEEKSGNGRVVVHALQEIRKMAKAKNWSTLITLGEMAKKIADRDQLLVGVLLDINHNLSLGYQETGRYSDAIQLLSEIEQSSFANEDDKASAIHQRAMVIYKRDVQFAVHLDTETSSSISESIALMEDAGVRLSQKQPVALGILDVANVQASLGDIAGAERSILLSSNFLSSVPDSDLTGFTGVPYFQRRWRSLWEGCKKNVRKHLPRLLSLFMFLTFAFLGLVDPYNNNIIK